jgi:hypothetical protein
MAESDCQKDPELLRVLEEMLELDEDITARAAARRHAVISHASSITRSTHRSEMVASFRVQQAERRGWSHRLQKRSREKAASELTARDARIKVLEGQVETLRVSHLAMIRAVGELGGMAKWRKLFEEHREIRESLRTVGALPEAGVAEIRSDR